MKALADYAHAKGLKFGLYSDAGLLTCAGRPGSLGYEKIDAHTYAKWGVSVLRRNRGSGDNDLFFIVNCSVHTFATVPQHQNTQNHKGSKKNKA